MLLVDYSSYRIVTDEMMNEMQKEMFHSIWQGLKIVMPYLIILIIIRIVFEIIMAKIERRNTHKIEHDLHIHIDRDEIKKAMKEIKDEEENEYRYRKPRR